jgi:hypothetical protein
MAVVALADYLPRMGASETDPETVHESPFVDPVAEAVAAARRETEAHYEARLAALGEENNAVAERRIAEARSAWIGEQAEPIAARINAAFDDLETSLADSVARVLAPFLATAARRRAIDDLLGTIRGLLRGSGHPAIRVSGPGDLLARIETQLGALAASVEFVAGDEVDVTVVLGRSIIATQIGVWVNRLGNPEGEGNV